MPSRSARSYGMQLDLLAAALDRRGRLLEARRVAGDEHQAADTSGSRLIRIAAARPMPWLAPVMTHDLAHRQPPRPMTSA